MFKVLRIYSLVVPLTTILSGRVSTIIPILQTGWR